MTGSPEGSPTGVPQRPVSGAVRPSRSSSRMSTGSKQERGSRASDEESKTAVKVAVRVRPPFKPTDPGYELIPPRFQRSMVHVTSPTSLAVDVPQGRKLFVFDRVFPETTDQEGIWEYVSDSVNSFLQGYNVSILAYGQSGAGKSYTMGTGSPNAQNDPKSMGIIPRAAQMLFEKLGEPPKPNRNSSSGLRTPGRYSLSSQTRAFGKNGLDKNWQLKATYVEIYNEQLRDLLLPESTPLSGRSSVTIREDPKGRIILTGLHQVNINSFEDLMGALNFGSSIRQTDATAINAKSSRSHAVFSLNLVQRKSSGGSTISAKDKRLSVPVEALSGSDSSVTIDSKLHFVDLAGSERLKNTGASGERAKEGIAINAGLAALGKVISQLSSRQSGAHVSYRDSKLTRLLQDSLGGNAITYMIACVTPAEFHLSETLNTIQYAQRARAIQSKPRIQQVADESDKQAVIDRLKAEVAFLRQQLRNSEAERRSAAPQERTDRPSEREIELQNQLLDIQESYTALSQRHAKLISELTKASEYNGDPEEIASVIGNSSVERLKRSHSFAESVEHVVLEYEKTIQSLESSLSNTRTSLANTESALLERETKCAYIETVNAQLQARIQKLMDREANTESYLHELESKLDGHASGEEKYAAIVADLKKELARARENEASCEEYISRLEERLAEADQDIELMQREMERLEHVIERQRSLGKLDNLLYELDHIQQNGTKRGESKGPASDPVSIKESQKAQGRTQSLNVLAEAAETAIPESDDDVGEHPPDVGEVDADAADDSRLALEQASEEQGSKGPAADNADASESSVQAKFLAEKLESVTQELFDLRIQHESTTNEYELLASKYEEALRTIAELQQDAADESRHPPTAQAGLVSPVTASRPASFLGDSRVHELKTGGPHSSSRSLSSELSLAEESAISQEASDANSVAKKESSEVRIPDASDKGEQVSSEVENLRKLLEEHQEGMTLVTQKYAQLQAEHEQTLGLVEQLKAELHRAKSSPSPTSPGPKSTVIRRISSQSLMSTVDRAHRCLAALRNIAVEEFEDRPDIMQNFDVHLNAAMHELHTRMERIQALEAENMSIKKEMETKSQIISGLTRERNSLHGSSADMTLVSQLRDQIVQQENHIASLKEAHDKREKELLAEIQHLTQVIESKEAAAKALEDRSEKQEKKIEALESEISEWQGKHQNAIETSGEQEKKIGALESEISEWKDRHQTAVESLQSSEKQLNTTLAELEAALASIEAMRAERAAATDSSAAEQEAVARMLEDERAKHQELVDSLRQEIEYHKSTIDAHLEAIADLEKSYAVAQEQLSQQAAAKEANDSELATYRSRVFELEQEIEAQKSLVDSQRRDLESLQESHRKELAELETRATAAAQAEYESRLAEQNAKHEEALNALRSEISGSKDEVTKLLETVSKILGAPVTSSALSDQIEDILSQKKHFSDRCAELIDANEELLRQLDNKSGLDGQVKELTEKSSQQEAKINELAHLVASLEETLREKEEVIKKKDKLIEEINAEKQKSVRLVEELEEQITNTFDQHHNRLSTIQQEKDQALEEANKKITGLEKEIESYRARIEQLELQLRHSSVHDGSLDRAGSLTSSLRKNSAASLPSPPPAIPLPPLPTIASTASGSMSPPSSRHASKELVSAQLLEDQEARIRTIEKHLYAEKQLTATLEEALGDLEAQSNKVKADMEAWKKKAWQYEDELAQLRKERNSTRASLQAMEEERNARREAEAARAQLEERMNAISKKKKKSTLNCF